MKGKSEKSTIFRQIMGCADVVRISTLLSRSLPMKRCPEQDCSGNFWHIYLIKMALIRANTTGAILAVSNTGKMELTWHWFALNYAWRKGGQDIALLIHSLLLEKNKQHPGTFQMCTAVQTLLNLMTRLARCLIIIYYYTVDLEF
jgi:hypothetical protein